MSPEPAIVLYEDDAVSGLSPIADTRPAFELRVGALCLRERLEIAFPSRSRHAAVRGELQALLEWSLPELARGWTAPTVLLVNARAHAELSVLRGIGDGPDGVCRVDGTIVFARLGGDRAQLFVAGSDALADLADLSPPAGLRLLRHPWEIVHANGAALCDDHRSLRGVELPERRIFGVRFDEAFSGASLLAPTELGGPDRAIVYPGVHVIEEDNVLYGAGARIRPGAVLDAERGPILLGPGCVIHPQAVIVGPAWIGPGSTVNPGAKLREGTSVGAWCKVGGEVEEAVLLDLSNKQHDGFLGHAVLGSWVNLGADTNGSDLKNNYGTVRVDLGDGPIDTGERFVGPMIGDHAKTGINTMLSTGCVIGVCANVFGADFPPRRVPAFTWGGAASLSEYRLDRALETAQVVFGRRQARWTDHHTTLLTRVFERSARERAGLG